MLKNSNIASTLLFLALSGILIFCWFRFGHIYGGGDTGLPTYNAIAGANIAGNIWYDSLAPGIPVGNALTVAPVLYMLSIPQALGASPVFIQALLFFILLFLMGYGMYLLALNIFGKPNYLLAVSAGVFYLFNPYMMIQIWHRFIHNSMFFVAFLPYLVMTWLWWIRKRNPKYLLLFLLVNFLAVYIYGTIAFIVAVWALLFLLTLLEAIVPWKGKKEVSWLFLAFLIGCIFWLLTNSWWLIPTFSVSPALFASVHTTDGSLGTLMSLSASSILPYTLRLINPFYLYWQADFGSSYQNIILQIISWLFVLVVAIGFVRGLRQKAYTAWSLLLLIIIFLSKGAASPFSFSYIWGFSHFFPLGVIRNPFEKLGVILPLVYAILFYLGLQFLLTTGVKYIGKSKTIFLLTIFIILHMAFFWPMFVGKLFGTLDKQNFVEVPESYTQANEWIKQDLKNTANPAEGRILHLPLPQSEGVTYNWQYGYHGVEPSAAIFTSLPSIARGLDMPGVSDALAGLSLIFHKPYASNPAVILKMLQDFSVKYVLLHKDTEWLGGELYNPLETETVLDKLAFLTKEEVFGDLTIYRLKDPYFSPKIVISDHINLLYPSQKNLFWPWMISTSSAQMITTTDSKSVNIPIKSQGDLLFPKASVNKELFEVPSKSKYEILMTDAQVRNFYSDQLSSLFFLINGEKKSLSSSQSDNLLSFGQIELNSGLNEIGYDLTSSENLLSTFEKWNRVGDVKELGSSVFQMNLGTIDNAHIESDLRNGIHGGGTYRVSFNISTNQVTIVFVQILQDSDLNEKTDNNILKGRGVRNIPSSLCLLVNAGNNRQGILEPLSRQCFLVNTGGNWQNVSLLLPQLRPVTQKAKLRLVMISPYQSALFQTANNILIKDLRIERILNNSLVLRNINGSNDFSDSTGEVFSIRKDGSFLYQGGIKLNKPALLIFKETFHPDWKLEFSENQKSYYPQKHYLGNLYANAWYIDKLGEYNFKISFTPQNYVNLGITVATLSYVGLFILSLVRNFLKINRKK
ncbi:MAG: hypothetical protein Q8P20_07770 [bacterium]|nr:hypothetical protein [bacterium]